MRNGEDRGNSKLLFLLIMVLIVYLAFFNFNVPVAYTSTVQGVRQLFNSL